MIAKVKTPKQRRVLQLRYIEEKNGRPLYYREIVDIMAKEFEEDRKDYDSAVYKLNDRALESFSKIYVASVQCPKRKC